MPSQTFDIAIALNPAHWSMNANQESWMETRWRHLQDWAGSIWDIWSEWPKKRQRQRQIQTQRQWRQDGEICKIGLGDSPWAWRTIQGEEILDISVPEHSCHYNKYSTQITNRSIKKSKHKWGWTVRGLICLAPISSQVVFAIWWHGVYVVVVWLLWGTRKAHRGKDWLGGCCVIGLVFLHAMAQFAIGIIKKNKRRCCSANLLHKLQF